MKLVNSLAWLMVLVWTPPTMAQRIVATSNFTIFVAPAADCRNGYFGAPDKPVTECGNDLTGKGTQGAPYATPQWAIDEIYAKYDFVGSLAPTIQIACAANEGQFKYPGMQISGRLVGQPGGMLPLIYVAGHAPFPIGKYNPFVIRGCPSNPHGALINPGVDGRRSIIALSLTGGAVVKVQGLSFDTTHAGQDCVDVFTGALLDLSDVEFGNASNDLRRIHIGVAWGGTLVVTGPISVMGNASSFLETGSSGTAYWNNNGDPKISMEVTIIGNPKFSNGFLNSNMGQFGL